MACSIPTDRTSRRGGRHISTIVIGHARNVTFFALVRFLVSYFALLVIGVGSWLFHMTLLYTAQMLDEIPMVFGSSLMVYCIFQVNRAINATHSFIRRTKAFVLKVRQPPGERNVLLASLLLVYSLVFVGVYLIIDKPLFQEVRRRKYQFGFVRSTSFRHFQIIYGILVFIMMVLDLDLTIKQSSRFNTCLFIAGMAM